LLSNCDRDVQLYAARTLALLADIPPALVNQVYRSPDDFDKDLDLADVDSVIHRIKNDGPNENRMLFVAALAYQDRAKSKIISDTLIELFEHETDPGVLDEAFRVLWVLGMHAESALDVVSVCIKLIDFDPRPEIKERAILTVDKYGLDVGSEAVPALIRALDDASINVRLAACSVLGSLGTEAKASVPKLCHALKGEPAECQEAARALLRIDPEGHSLAKHLDDFSKPVLTRELRRIGKPARDLRNKLEAHLSSRGIGGIQNNPL
jgi:HEAT repeat protein